MWIKLRPLVAIAAAASDMPSALFDVLGSTVTVLSAAFTTSRQFAFAAEGLYEVMVGEVRIWTGKRQFIVTVGAPEEAA